MSRSFSPRLTLFIALANVSLLAPSVALAADSVVGKWQGTLETQRGATEVTLDFKGSDEDLQGTWTGQRGTSDLEDVEYESGSLTFVRNVEAQGNAFTLNFAATIDGDTMSVTMSTPRGEIPFTVARVK